MKAFVSNLIRPWPAFIMLASALLLYLAVPRFLSELMLVPGKPILERINRGEVVSEADIDALILSRKQALTYVEKPQSYLDLGTAYVTRARTLSVVEQQQAAAQEAITYLLKGLEKAPYNAFAWMRLCTAYYMLGGLENREKAVEAWRTSIHYSRVEPFLYQSRIYMGVILYREISEADRKMLMEQTRLAYDNRKWLLRNYARQYNLVEWVAFLLRDTPEKAEWIKK